LQIKTKIVSSHTADSKPVKQEVNGTVILPPLVFPGVCVGMGIRIVVGVLCIKYRFFQGRKYNQRKVVRRFDSVGAVVRTEVAEKILRNGRKRKRKWAAAAATGDTSAMGYLLGSVLLNVRGLYSASRLFESKAESLPLESSPTCGLYYKPIIIVNDNSRGRQ
jgi:hypothetical protein